MCTAHHIEHDVTWWQVAHQSLSHESKHLRFNTRYIQCSKVAFSDNICATRFPRVRLKAFSLIAQISLLSESEWRNFFAVCYSWKYHTNTLYVLKKSSRFFCLCIQCTKEMKQASRSFIFIASTNDHEHECITMAQTSCFYNMNICSVLEGWGHKVNLSNLFTMQNSSNMTATV